MARGPKPKPTHIKLVTGNPGKRPLPQDEPQPRGPLSTRPRYLKGRAAKLYDDILVVAWWLRDADTYKAGMWCVLQAEFEKSAKQMNAGRIAQLRTLASELGLDPASRARLGVVGGKRGKEAQEKPKEKDPYFGD